MSENFDFENSEQKKKRKFGFLLNILLFILTFFSTSIAGVAWLNQNPYALENFTLGLQYAVLLLAIITFHEFGHYFAAKYHKIDVTLPYYIPFPFLFLNPFGTMGAVIKMKSPAQTRKSLFDVGIAGPIAGWVVSMIILLYGYLTLPNIDYLFKIHPEYITNGIPTTGLTFGSNLIFLIFEKIFYTSKVFIPPMNEVYHYPFLCAGWFGLLITSLNMMPVGQLDGGHISYTMFGTNHKIIAHIIFYLLVIFGLLGLLPFLNINFELGSVNWLVWAILIYFVIKIEHPPICTDIEQPLGNTRLILGWFSFFIFITSFCPIPISEI
jgi:membrane-associated protease RseP (regulator of RpoE activity)